MLSALSQLKPVLPWTRIFSVASHSTPQVKPNPPLGLASAHRRFRNSDHARPFFGEPVVVMGFAVMDIAADARTLAVGVIEIPGDFGAGIILEQFGIGPLHSAFGQQEFGRVPRSAKAFEQKNGFGKFLLDAGDDVLPGGHGNFVAGVAAETVHAAPAPDEERSAMMSQSLTSCCSSSTRSSQTVPQAPGLANSPSGFFRKNSG